MFLPGVEGNPQPGPYNDNLQPMRAAGKEYPQWRKRQNPAPLAEAAGRHHRRTFCGASPVDTHP